MLQSQSLTSPSTHMSFFDHSVHVYGSVDIPVSLVGPFFPPTPYCPKLMKALFYSPLMMMDFSNFGAGEKFRSLQVVRLGKT